MGNAATVFSAQQPYFYDTRGKAFLATNQYAKAISDFERDLTASEIRGEVQLSLSKAYEDLPDSQTPARHSFLSRTFLQENPTVE